MPILMDMGFVEDIGVGGIDGLQARHGDTIYPASGPRGGNPTCCLSDCIDDVITGVSKLGLRVRWVALCTGVVAMRLLV